MGNAPALVESGASDAGLQKRLQAFWHEAPYEQSVFVMMRYRPGPQFHEIEASIESTVAEYELKARMAKDAAYADDLWENIRTYMHGC